MIHSQHKSIFGITRGGGGDQRFFSQLLNNLQTLPVHSLRLYSRQTTRVEGGRGEEEKKEDRLFGKTAVKRGQGHRARGMLNT